MTHASLFSGIGGFEIAAEWCGWENVFHCEINPFGRRVLEYYWPESISYEDIKKTDFTKHRGAIDVLSGGFPCQPFSAAGKRKGTEDDRHLWPEMLRAIREIRPSWVVGENVRGLTNWNGGLVFDQVQADLESEGYEVLPFLLPACALNAPHRRDRIWIVAHREDLRQRNSKNTGRERKEHFQNNVETVRSSSYKYGQGGTSPDTGGSGYTEREEHEKGQQHGRGGKSRSKPASSGGQWDVADTGIIKSQRRMHTDGRRGWEDFPTQPPVRGRDDELPTGLSGITIPKHRNESIKAYGNAIVPNVAYEIFKVIDYEFT